MVEVGPSLLFLSLVCMLVGARVWWETKKTPPTPPYPAAVVGVGSPTRGHSRHSDRTVTCSSRLPHTDTASPQQQRALTGWVPARERSPVPEAFPVRLRARSEAGRWGLPEKHPDFWMRSGIPKLGFFLNLRN